MKTYKGFNRNMQCQGFQFEESKEYTHPGEVKCCPQTNDLRVGKGGFHACEKPIDCFGYYAPGDSIFREVEQDGDLDRNNEDSKVASKTIKIGAIISIKAMVEASIKFVFEKCDWSKKENHSTGNSAASSATGDRAASSATGYSAASSATGYSAASSATGYRAASSATGYSAASSATGDRAASSATGNRAASSATGNRAASSATGYRAASSATGYSAASSATGYSAASSATGHSAASSATGDRAASLTTGSESSSEIKDCDTTKSKNSIAIAIGPQSKVRASLGNWITISEWNKDFSEIKKIITVKVDGKKIKADTWYEVKGGKIVRAKS